MAFLANKIEGDNKEMPMKAFIAMGQKMGLPLSYPAIKKAYDENPNLQNLIALTLFPKLSNLGLQTHIPRTPNKIQ